MTDALPGAPRDEGKAPPGDSNIGRQQRREGLRTAKAYRRERAFFKLSPRSAAMADADALMKKADKRRVRSARGRGEARLGLAGLARMTRGAWLRASQRGSLTPLRSRQVHGVADAVEA
jgi:hypothetical protein